MRHDLFDSRPAGGAGYLLLALFILACWAWSSSGDYIDARKEECGQKQLDYDASSDSCVLPLNER